MPRWHVPLQFRFSKTYVTPVRLSVTDPCNIPDTLVRVETETLYPVNEFGFLDHTRFDFSKNRLLQLAFAVFIREFEEVEGVLIFYRKAGLSTKRFR